MGQTSAAYATVCYNTGVNNVHLWQKLHGVSGACKSTKSKIPPLRQFVALGHAKRGNRRLQVTDHRLEDAPRHPLEELADEEDGKIPREEREEDEARDGDERAQDRPAVAPALGYHTGDLCE